MTYRFNASINVVICLAPDHIRCRLNFLNYPKVCFRICRNCQDSIEQMSYNNSARKCAATVRGSMQFCANFVIPCQRFGWLRLCVSCYCGEITKILQTQGSISQLKSQKSRYYKTSIWQTSAKCFAGFLEEFGVRLGVKIPATVVQQAI